jgi:hypothetical protein
MKLVITIFSIILLAGCGGPKNTEMEQSNESVKEWLSFSGGEEKPHIVLVTGDEEYRSEEALPQLAKMLSQHHGFNCTVLFAQDPENPGVVDPNYLHNIPGLEHLKDADLMIIFTRFRALPDNQMKYIDDYLKNGKPVLGIRTATHGFEYDEVDFESSYRHYSNSHEEDDEWRDGFGRLVLGEKWISHHGEHGDQSTRGLTAPGAEEHPILSGIEEGGIWGPTDVYGVRLPLPGDSQPIVLGQVVNRDHEFEEDDPRLGMRPTDSELPGRIMVEDDDDQEVEIDQNDPMMPVAWTKSYQIPGGQTGKVFATTIGASTDLLAEGTRRMMVNAVFWLLDLEVPEKANVDLVGPYHPSRFAFHDDEHWDQKNLKITELE